MRFKVLSYNIHKGFETWGLKLTLHEMKAAIHSVQADLVFLQEVVGENRKHQRSHRHWPKQAQFEYLADSLWPHFSYGKNAVFEESHHGNALLSKFPIIEEENINISNHKWEQRGLLHCIVQIPFLDHAHLHLFNVHLDLWEKGRKKQIQKIVHRGETRVPKDRPLILAGDFNDWPGKLSAHLSGPLKLKDSYKIRHGHYAKTFPSYFPLMTLDRVYFRNLSVVSVETLTGPEWRRLSDHLPLLVEFEWNSSDSLNCDLT